MHKGVHRKPHLPLSIDILTTCVGSYSNTEFVGFNTNGCSGIGVTEITGKCSFGCGGYTYKFEGESLQSLEP